MAGFADGIKSGFGLVNDVYDRRSKDNYRTEAIALEKQGLVDKKADNDRMYGLKNREMTITENTETDRVKNNKLERQRIQQGIKNDQQAVLNAQSVNRQATTTDRKANITLDAAEAELQAQKEFRDKQQSTAISGTAATRLHDINPQTNEDYKAAWDDVTAVYNDPVLGAMFKDSLQTLSKYEDMATFEAIKDLSEGQEITNGVFESGLESIISGSVWGREGVTITAETHPNAPPRMRGMKVVGSEIYSMAMGKDATVSAQVSVRVTDGKGRIATYLAPMSAKRAGDTQPVSLKVDDLIAAFAARAKFSGFMQENKSNILETIKRKQYQTAAGDLDTNAFATAVAETKSAEIQSITDRGMTDSPIVRGSSVTWGEFMKTQDFDRYVEEKTLIPDRRANSTRNETAFLITEMNETPEIRKINKRRAIASLEPLSDTDVLKASVYFNAGKNGYQAESSREWNSWKSKMSGATNVDMSGYGTEATESALDGFYGRPD